VRHDRRNTSRYKPYFLGPYVYFQDGDTTYLLLILIRNLLIEQDALSEARQLETLICSVMYGERRYTIDIDERAPLLEALMTGKPYEVKADDRPSVRNLWERYGDLEEQLPLELRGEALPYFHDWLLHRVCLVGIEAHDQGHGWEIFETMNDRGLQLSPVDLLKSFLLAKSEQKQPRRLNDTWRTAMTGLSALGGMGAATDFVKALLIGRYADPDDASDLTRIETSFHEWIRGNETRMNLVRPADFAAFVTDEFAPHAEAYCKLFWAAQSPESNTDLQSLFFNHVNGIRSQFQLIFAAVRRSDSPDQIRSGPRPGASPTTSTCSMSTGLSPGTPRIPPNSTPLFVTSSSWTTGASSWPAASRSPRCPARPPTPGTPNPPTAGTSGSSRPGASGGHSRSSATN
jgi:hypothetical protein